MAGHSKWKQIKRKKAVTDSRRASAWTKLIREITISAKAGGGDIGGNPRLRLAVDTAKAANMPNINIDRAIKKGTGELEGETIVELAYEGYGPGGVAARHREMGGVHAASARQRRNRIKKAARAVANCCRKPLLSGRPGEYCAPASALAGGTKNQPRGRTP